MLPNERREPRGEGKRSRAGKRRPNLMGLCGQGKMLPRNKGRVGEERRRRGAEEERRR
jgi:hypothetical protein